ncbi:MAG TPA: 3-ketoacyl-ACP reductase [Acidobacteriaceae bacterium]|nr:3-ketoacyl-ACP reductase [Acidobacteriaceae bacterium]
MGDERRVALITGGTRGIGLGIAIKLAEAGLAIAISGRRPAEDVQPVVAQLGPGSIYIQADVASTADRQRLIETVESKLGGMDVLVNNAGIAPRVRADILEAGEESFDELIATNLRGPYFLTQSVASWMIRHPAPGRSIINISSVSATVASVNRGDYCIAKAGIAMATKLWAVRLAEHGIGVYEVRPGIIETDMTAGVKGKYDALIESGILLQKRWGTPEDIGTAVCMLAAGQLPYATGAVLVLDGGLTMARL